MMDFKTVQDLLDNEEFRQWLQTNDPVLEKKWKQWLALNEDKSELFYKAVSTWLLVNAPPKNWSEERISEKLETLKQKLHQRQSPRVWTRFWYYAAAMVILSLVGLYFIEPFQTPTPITQSSITAPEKSWETFENNNDFPLLINLPDGSSVLLNSGSQLWVDPAYNHEKRSVQLHGEGFFEVVKNENIPFFVHTSTLTTRVLGTSFTVRSYDKEHDAKVTVVSGKVEVYTATGNQPIADTRFESQRVILTKNEEVTWQKATEKLLKSIPETGVVAIPHLPQQPSFDLKFVLAPEIFVMLENMYGVQIHYDKERFRNCTLTANLEGLPFLKKLELICAGMDATFSIQESEVTIEGNGC